jgi:hypothetical protein
LKKFKRLIAMKNLLATLLVLFCGNLLTAQTSQDDIQAEMQRIREQMEEQMAQFQQLMQESLDSDFFQSIPYRDTMILKEFNLGDGLGEIDTESIENMMRDLREQMQMQFEQLKTEDWFRDGFGGPAVPAPEQLEPSEDGKQNNDVKPRKNRRETHSL